MFLETRKIQRKTHKFRGYVERGSLIRNLSIPSSKYNFFSFRLNDYRVNLIKKQNFEIV